MTPRKFPATRGRTHHRSSSSISNANAQAPNGTVPFPALLITPVLNPSDLAALRCKFPDIYREADTPELLSSVRLPRPPDGLNMLDGIHGSYIETPPIRTGQLPSQLQISLPETGCIPPTHIIACPPTGNRMTYKLFLVHANVFESNCASLPRPFPPSLAAAPSNSSSTLELPNLPVVTYNLPSPKAFLAMQTWLYTKNDSVLMEMVRPSNRSLWTTSCDDADRQLDFLYGMWRNACYLGIADMAIYDVIKGAWREVYTIRASLSR